MQRALLLTGLVLAAIGANAAAFDDFYYDDGGWGFGYDDYYYDDYYYDDYYDDYNTPRSYKYMPFSPGAQNQNLGWNNGWDNTWNNGWNNNWQQQQNWNYQPRPQYQTPQVVYSQQPIKISMPPAEAGLCAYVLSSGGQSWNYTISPGKSQQFKEDRAWQVTYDRGNGYGHQTYSLKPGHYRFRQSSRGWELYRSDVMDDTPIAQAPPPPM